MRACEVELLLTKAPSLPWITVGHQTTSSTVLLLVPGSSNTALNTPVLRTETIQVVSTGSSHQQNLDVSFLTSLCSWPVAWTWQSCLEKEKYTVPLADAWEGWLDAAAVDSCFNEIIQEGLQLEGCWRKKQVHLKYLQQGCPNAPPWSRKSGGSPETWIIYLLQESPCHFNLGS